MTIKRVYRCYECGKVISNIFAHGVWTLDDLNYAHSVCLK